MRGAVCFSGGKDSCAMLIELLRRIYEEGSKEYNVSAIFFADTKKEFPDLYAYIAKIEKYIQDRFDPELKVEFTQAKRREWMGDEDTWDEWFYGSITRGANEGKTRGAPLRAYPCWWAREAKVYPLQEATKDYDVIYMGIASDEAHRQTTQTDERSLKLKYPLIEWGWTEPDCFKYLDDLELMNELYVNFTRLGCFHCIKQPPDSWWSLYQGYPELWEEAKRWDEESLRVSGHGLRSMEPGKDGWLLSEMEQRFKDGWIPNGRTKFDCNSCDAVRFVAQGQMTLADFEGSDDNAHERLGLIDAETPACEIPWEKDASCDITQQVVE